jgi:GNAT superfamily N-acetyltransferase
MTAESTALSSYARARSWLATTAGLRVDEVVQLDQGAWALRTPSWELSFSHNCLLLTTDPGPERILTLVADALPDVTHRHITAFCVLGAQSLAALMSSGYQVQPEIVMTRAVQAGPLSTPDVEVTTLEPDSAQLNALQERLWHEEWLPAATDLAVAQLVERRSELNRAGNLVSLGVAAAESDELVATMDVCMRDGIAEFDGLAVLRPYRGKNYGQALFARAWTIAAASDCDLVVLDALRDDWPRNWYERLGFVTVGPATEASLSPATLPNSESSP